MQTIDQVIMSCVKSPFGVLLLTLIGIGIVLLLLTYLPFLLGIIILGFIIFLVLMYFGFKL